MQLSSMQLTKSGMCYLVSTLTSSAFLFWSGVRKMRHVTSLWDCQFKQPSHQTCWLSATFPLCLLKCALLQNSFIVNFLFTRVEPSNPGKAIVRNPWVASMDASCTWTCGLQVKKFPDSKWTSCQCMGESESFFPFVVFMSSICETQCGDDFANILLWGLLQACTFAHLVQTRFGSMIRGSSAPNANHPLALEPEVCQLGWANAVSAQSWGLLQVQLEISVLGVMTNPWTTVHNANQTIALENCIMVSWQIHGKLRTMQTKPLHLRIALHWCGLTASLWFENFVQRKLKIFSLVFFLLSPSKCPERRESQCKKQGSQSLAPTACFKFLTTTKPKVLPASYWGQHAVLRWTKPKLLRPFSVLGKNKIEKQSLGKFHWWCVKWSTELSFCHNKSQCPDLPGDKCWTKEISVHPWCIMFWWVSISCFVDCESLKFQSDPIGRERDVGQELMWCVPSERGCLSLDGLFDDGSNGKVSEPGSFDVIHVTDWSIAQWHELLNLRKKETQIVNNGFVFTWMTYFPTMEW